VLTRVNSALRKRDFAVPDSTTTLQATPPYSARPTVPGAQDATAPAHRCTGASLYLTPRSLGAACWCSPGATLCELGDSLPKGDGGTASAGANTRVHHAATSTNGLGTDKIGSDHGALDRGFKLLPQVRPSCNGFIGVGKAGA
jgi:hypothetical protein